MSGGEKKKNELLQIDVLKPSLILLDELDSGLDIDSLRTLSNGLLEYKRETKASILIITHHTNILEYLTPDKVYILNGGRITMEGDMELANKLLRFRSDFVRLRKRPSSQFHLLEGYLFFHYCNISNRK